MMGEKAKGKAKEAYGAMTGDEGKKAEGNAQQRNATAREEREQQKRTKAEQDKAERAEKSREKQEHKNKGSWATSGIPSRDDRRPPSPLHPGPEPILSENIRRLHAFTIAELLRTPCMRSSQNSIKAKFAEFTFYALG